MISHPQECIFVHIPKTAGTSIELFFKNELDLPAKAKAPLVLSKNKVGEIGPPHLTHLKAHEFYENCFISEELFDSYFKFSFVRNPWDRVVSFYKYSNLNLLISFKTFVNNELPKLLKERSYFYAPQYDFIYQNGEKLVDFVGRFEQLQKDFDKVCDKLDISDSKLPHERKSKVMTIKKRCNEMYKKLKRRPGLVFKYRPDRIDSSNYRDYYSNNSLKEKVYDLYKHDVEEFGYSF